MHANWPRREDGFCADQFPKGRSRESRARSHQWRGGRPSVGSLRPSGHFPASGAIARRVSATSSSWATSAGTFQIGEKDFSNILRKELAIYGTWNSKVTPVGSDDWTTVLRFMDRGLQIAPLFTDRLPLEQGPAIFDEIVKRRGFHNKVIFDITPEVTR